MKISVIMLTYNRENLVKRAIESIQKQTYKDFEFIIVDNGSTDHSAEIVDAYAARDRWIQVIHHRRGSIGNGRNIGLKMATGEFITFIDDDDWCEPDYLDFLYQLVEKNRADISICGAFREEEGRTTFIGVSDDVIVMNAEEAIVELMWRKRYNTGFPTKLIRRSLFKELPFTETGQYEDITLLYKILARAKTVVSYGLPKYHVYRHKGNHSLATTKDAFITPEYLKAYRKAYKERRQWLCENFPQKTDYWKYFEWSFQISMINKILSNGLKGCEKHLSEMQKELCCNRDEFLNSPYILDFEKRWVERYVPISHLEYTKITREWRCE